MGELKNNVETVIKANYQGANVSLDIVSMSDRVSGVVVWAGFAEQDQRERQQHLREILRQHFAQDIAKLGIILAFSPAEAEALGTYGHSPVMG